MYREPQKFLALLVVAYAVGVGVGLHALIGRRSPLVQGAAAVVALAGILAYGYTELWGLSGQVHLSRYPDSWAAADEAMLDRGDGTLLVFPWVPYAVWTFSDGRIVANPAASFFSRPVLSADGAGFQNAPPPNVDAFRVYVGQLLSDRKQLQDLGRLLAPLDVRFVAWLKEVDWWRYPFLRRQSDLRLIYDSEEIDIFENLAWTPPPTRLADEELVEEPPIVPPESLAFPAIGARFSPSRTIEPAGTPFVATGDRCTDGWQLGDQDATCHMGAVATFRSPESPQRLWRPEQAIGTIGLAVSGAALAAALFVLRPRRRRLKRSDDGI
jgi:hypothetical protein